MISMIREGTWTSQPLPLYDTAGKIVHPTNYEGALRGSLTSIRFSLTRHWDAHSDCYRYRANVEEIHLIAKTQVSIACLSHTKLVESIRKQPAPHSESS